MLIILEVAKPFQRLHLDVKKTFEPVLNVFFNGKMLAVTSGQANATALKSMEFWNVHLRGNYCEKVFGELVAL